jgi:hypothetical protein
VHCEQVQRHSALAGDDPETMRMKAQLNEQDQDLDEIHGALGRLHGAACLCCVLLWRVLTYMFEWW